MEKATISQLKNSLSAYLKKVRGGQSVLILDRNEPIAVLERVNSNERPEGRLARLEQAGYDSALAHGAPTRRVGDDQAAEVEKERTYGAARRAPRGAVRFWDSSAIVPLLVDEAQLKQTRAQLEHDSAMLVWWGTPVECASALARRERDGSLDSDGMRIALQRLRALAEQWHEACRHRHHERGMFACARRGRVTACSGPVAAERDPPVWSS